MTGTHGAAARDRRAGYTSPDDDWTTLYRPTTTGRCSVARRRLDDALDTCGRRLDGALDSCRRRLDDALDTCRRRLDDAPESRLPTTSP